MGATPLAAANPHLRGGDSETAVATIFNEIVFTLARGDRVELLGFGAFTVRRREAYVAETRGLASPFRFMRHQPLASGQARICADAWTRGKALHGRQRVMRVRANFSWRL
jgi:hypothetical protein